MAKNLRSRTIIQPINKKITHNKRETIDQTKVDDLEEIESLKCATIKTSDVNEDSELDLEQLAICSLKHVRENSLLSLNRNMQGQQLDEAIRPMAMDNDDGKLKFVIDRNSSSLSSNLSVSPKSDNHCNDVVDIDDESDSSESESDSVECDDLAISEVRFDCEGGKKSPKRGSTSVSKFNVDRAGHRTHKTSRSKMTTLEVGEAKGKRGNNRLELSTSLQPGINKQETYINMNLYSNPKVVTKKVDQMSYKTQQKEVMQKSVLTPGVEKLHQLPPYEVGKKQMKRQRKKERSKTKGTGWFNLPATEVTDETKNDLMVIQMRRVLDPKQFYKGPDLTALPKYFQTGTIVETAADFYSSRIPKKERKKTLVDELLGDAEFRRYNKRKYAEITASTKQKGAYKHMKRLKKQKK